MKNETARQEIESLDYYLQNHTNDYSEESHTAMMMAIKALEQEPSGDAISRQAVIDEIYESRKNFNNEFDQGFFADKIKALPPVTPQPKTGHWIRGKERHFLDTRTNLNVEMKEATGKGYHTYINAQCSKCRMITIHDDSILYQYCPHCGARMFEPQESEEV